MEKAVNRLNKDIVHNIFDFLELKDISQLGKTNRQFNIIWRIYIPKNIIKYSSRTKEYYQYKNINFILDEKLSNFPPFIYILERCKKESNTIELNVKYIHNPFSLMVNH